MTFEYPGGCGGHEEIVSGYVDDRLGQQLIPRRLAEREHLLLVEQKGAVQALDAEKIPAADPAERPNRQRGREPRQSMLVIDSQLASIPCRLKRPLYSIRDDREKN